VVRGLARGLGPVDGVALEFLQPLPGAQQSGLHLLAQGLRLLAAFRAGALEQVFVIGEECAEILDDRVTSRHVVSPEVGGWLPGRSGALTATIYASRIGRWRPQGGSASPGPGAAASGAGMGQPRI